MADFLGPSQQMGQQLQGVLAEAAQSAADARAGLAQRQLEQQKMAKEMELNFALSEKMMPVNKELALEYFNLGLRPMGRAVTMENFDPSMTIFKQAAEFKQNNDPMGMAMLLKQSDKFLVNLNDQARAIAMQRQAQQGLAEQQAGAIQNLQPENPHLQRSRELLDLVGMVGGDLSRIQSDELVRLTGTTDPTAQEQALRLSQATVDGHDRYRQHLSTLFSLDPTAFGHAATVTAQSQANPKILAEGRIAELLQNPERSEAEERELMAKGSVYTPHLAEALNLKSAAREKERLTNQLEDTRTRLTALDEHLGVAQEAGVKAATLRTDSLMSTPSFDTALTPAEERDFKTWKQQNAPKDSGADYDLRGAFKAGLTPDATTGHWPDTYKKPNHPTFSDQSKYAQYGNPGRWEGETFIPGTASAGVTDQQAKEYRLKEGVRSLEGYNFYHVDEQGKPQGKVAPRIQALEQTAKEADQQREQLAKVAVSALPGQREVVTMQSNEYKAMANANRAMARLLKDENPYALATREAEIALIEDPAAQRTAQESLAQVKTQRDQDLQVVKEEQARLLRRETILQGKLPAAERKEEYERNLRLAHQAVDAAVLKGKPLSLAIREAGEQFQVDKKDLAKGVMEARGAGVPEAQMQLLSAAQQFKRTNGRDPESGEVSGMLLKVLKAYPGVKGDEVLPALKDINRPGVQVSLYDPKQNIQEAGKLANVNQAIQEIQDVRKVLTNPDGSINRAQLFAGSLNLPFTQGRGAQQMMEKAVEIKLRAATGAAARPEEMRLYARLFAPGNLDSDEAIKYKLDSFENWLQTVAETTDPSGDLRRRAESMLNQGTIQLLKTPEYLELRTKFPQASASEIVRFLQQRKAK